MATGTVRWFDDGMGYGYLVPDGGARTSSCTTPPYGAKGSGAWSGAIW